MKVLICGSRGWTDIVTVGRRIGELDRRDIVIHGGAQGADQMAGHCAKARGIHVAVVLAMWDTYGKSAGFKRNCAMLDLEPDLVLAFSLGTPGTQSTIDVARKRGIPVEVVGTEHPKEAESVA